MGWDGMEWEWIIITIFFIFKYFIIYNFRFSYNLVIKIYNYLKYSITFYNKIIIIYLLDFHNILKF